MPRPANPEQSLGDCAICMEAISVDTPRSSSLDLEDRCSEKVSTPLLSDDRKASVLGRVMKMFKASKVRKNYSLAPCFHLFVSG